MYLGHYLKRNSLLFKNRTALKSDSISLTWAELFNRSENLGRSLHALGLKKGDRVAFLGYDSIPFVEFHLALPACGLVAVPLNFRMVAR
jgi:fatty-acyl-CoA synthase